jgi:HD-GYP domain-containing protein (c-di-GMP phosphodiesterase class II)
MNMNINIHGIAVKRLFLSWILLSLVICGIDFILEMKNADHFFTTLAARESESFVNVILPYINRGEIDVNLLRQQATEFLKGHYARVEVYNRNRKKILDESGSDAKAVADTLRKDSTSLTFAESPDSRKMLIGSNGYVHLLLPLRDKNGTIAGYFAGVYRVEPERVDQIMTGVMRTMALIVLVAFLTTLVFYPILIFLHRGLVRFASGLLRGNIELMEMLGSAIAQRDSDTSLHNYRVTIYAIRLAEAIELDSVHILNLIAGAFLHDVGKIGISDTILLKPGELTEVEFAVMCTHVLLGVETISKSAIILEMADDVVEFHHEKFDGSGYLRGLKGEEIPLNARIFALADVFDALTSRRPYKEPFSFDTAMSIVHAGNGTHFEPDLVEVFSGIACDIYEQLKDAPEAEVELMLKLLASKHFFTNASLAQFMKNKIYHSWTAQPEERTSRRKGPLEMPAAS